MVYILAQRLQAQNVPADKSKRVLQDVVRTMYNPAFIAELFRAQDVYTMQSTRQIFDRLAHSSIMRLNESSMDKVCSAPLQKNYTPRLRSPRLRCPPLL